MEGLLLMKKKNIFLMLLLAAITLSSCKMAVLEPKGLIAYDERSLIFIAIALMLIIVIPVFVMTFIFVYKYRDGKNARYEPTWSHSTMLEIIWWTVPCIIIGILATITWISTHKLDPYKALDSDVPPVTIQVIALDWKWLFIYPKENIATINYIKLPINTPINFKITADAPMNSFWIPQLGGQIYAMTGMQTQLHLIANNVGDYDGSSASYSGAGFSGMKFIANVSSKEEFTTWVNAVKQTNHVLTANEYKQLVKPSQNVPVIHYSSVRKNLYEDIMMKFMMPDMDIK